jgi:hypothetical protein
MAAGCRSQEGLIIQVGRYCPAPSLKTMLKEKFAKCVVIRMLLKNNDWPDLTSLEEGVMIRAFRRRF